MFTSHPYSCPLLLLWPNPHLHDWNRTLFHFCPLTAFLNTATRVILLKLKSSIKILQQLLLSLNKRQSPDMAPKFQQDLSLPISPWPHLLLLSHSVPASLAFLLFLESARHTPASGSLDPLLPLPVLFITQIAAWLHSSRHSGCSLSVRFLSGLSGAPYLLPEPAYPWPPLYMSTSSSPSVYFFPHITLTVIWLLCPLPSYLFVYLLCQMSTSWGRRACFVCIAAESTALGKQDAFHTCLVSEWMKKVWGPEIGWYHRQP